MTAYLAACVLSLVVGFLAGRAYVQLTHSCRAAYVAALEYAAEIAGEFHNGLGGGPAWRIRDAIEREADTLTGWGKPLNVIRPRSGGSESRVDLI